jgi:hypothetical protein
MRREKGSLETVVNRLGSADTAMILHRYVQRAGSSDKAVANIPAA